MTPFLIQSEADYVRALALVERVWDAEPDTADFRVLDVMSERIHAYEARDLDRVLPPPTPGVVIAAKLRELGLSQRALARQLGWSSGRVSEVISGKRGLTLAMVRELAPALGIPAQLLVHDAGSEAVWVRVPKALADLAAALGECGQDSLDDLVAVALRCVLPGGTPGFIPGAIPASAVLVAEPVRVRSHGVSSDSTPRAGSPTIDLGRPSLAA